MPSTSTGSNSHVVNTLLLNLVIKRQYVKGHTDTFVEKHPFLEICRITWIRLEILPCTSPLTTIQNLWRLQVYFKCKERNISPIHGILIYAPSQRRLVCLSCPSKQKNARFKRVEKLCPRPISLQGCFLGNFNRIQLFILMVC